MPKGTIGNVQLLRAIAALIVVFGHSVSVQPSVGLPNAASLAYWFGISGVDIFFVISGFIVVTVAMREAEVGTRATSTFRFALKRIFRIYPVYWVALAAAAVVNSRWPLAESWFTQAPPKNLILLATRDNYLLPHAWTLAYEVYFYLVLAVAMLLFPKRIMTVVAVWIAAQCSAAVYVRYIGNKDLPIDYFKGIFLDPIVLEFGFGCTVAYLILRGCRSLAPAILVLGILWLLSGGLIIRSYGTITQIERVMTFGIGAALVLYAFIVFELNGTFAAPRWSQKLGDASYSIYLWHQMLLVTLAAITVGIRHFFPPIVMWAIWIAIILICGFLSYRFIEMPVQQAARRWLSRGARPAALIEPSVRSDVTANAG